MIELKLQLTKAQADVISWAIDPMKDIADDPEQVQDFGYGADHVPILEGRILDISRCNENAIADLLYRIEEQMVDMASDERAHRTVGMCIKLGEAIRSLWGENQWAILGA